MELLEIKSTVTSVFYRQPSPSEPPFVEVGSKVTPDTTVCLLEVMKCFRSVPAGVSGTVEEILVESGDVVNEDTIMFRVRPE